MSGSRTNTQSNYHNGSELLPSPLGRRAPLNDAALEEALRRRFSIFAARYGDWEAMSASVGSADRLAVEDLKATISIFGHSLVVAR